MSESTVLKVAKYLEDYLYPEYTEDPNYYTVHAKEIVKIVHESEDADE